MREQRTEMEPVTGSWAPWSFMCSMLVALGFPEWNSESCSPFRVPRIFPKPQACYDFCCKIFSTSRPLLRRGKVWAGSDLRKDSEPQLIPKKQPVISMAGNKHFNFGFSEGTHRPAHGVSDSTRPFSYYFCLACMTYVLLENIRTVQNFIFVIVEVYF